MEAEAVLLLLSPWPFTKVTVLKIGSDDCPPHSGSRRNPLITFLL